MIYEYNSYDIIKNKGYQSTDTVSSTVTTKVKGLGFVNNRTNFYTMKDDKIVFEKDNRLNVFDVDFLLFINFHLSLLYSLSKKLI